MSLSTAAVRLDPPADSAPRCLVCGDPLLAPIRRCSRCRTEYHEECWDYQRGCAVYACAAGARPGVPPGLDAEPFERATLFAEMSRERVWTEPEKDPDRRLAEFEEWARQEHPVAAPVWPTPRRRRRKPFSFAEFLAPRRSIPAVAAVIAWMCMLAAISCPLHGFPESSVREQWRSSTMWFLVFWIPVALLPCLPLLCWRPKWVGWRVISVLLAGAISGWCGLMASLGFEFGYGACNGCCHYEAYSLGDYANRHDGWYPRDGVSGFEALIAWQKEDDERSGLRYGIRRDLWVHHRVRPMGGWAEDELSSRTCFFTYIPGLRDDEDDKYPNWLVLGYWPDFVEGSYRVIQASYGDMSFMSADELTLALESTRQFMERKGRPYDPASFVLRTDYR